MSQRVNSIFVMAKRELRSMLYGLGFYMAIFISFLVSSYLLKNYALGIYNSGSSFIADPFGQPLYWSAIICSIYLSIFVLTSIAGDKEHRTIEVLFYGPVDDISYAVSKYLTGMMSYLMLAVLLVLYFLISSQITNFDFSLNFIQSVILSIFLASCMIAFGIFLSTFVSQVRTSILLFIVVMVGLLAIQIAYRDINSLLLSIVRQGVTKGASVEDISKAVPSSYLYIRDAVTFIYNLLRWISPFSYMSRGMVAASQGSNIEFWLSILSSVIYTLVMMGVSMIILRKKGVRIV